MCSAVAEWLQAPDTQFMLDHVRPDFLLLRVLNTLVMGLRERESVYVHVCVCVYVHARVSKYQKERNVSCVCL